MSGNQRENRVSLDFQTQFTETAEGIFFQASHAAIGALRSGPHATLEEAKTAALVLVRRALREMRRQNGTARGSTELRPFVRAVETLPARRPWTPPAITDTTAAACRWCGNDRLEQLTLGLTSDKQPCMICRDGCGCRAPAKGGAQ